MSPTRDRSSRLGIPFFASIAIGAALLSLSLMLTRSQEQAAVIDPISIGIEHTKPLLLSFAIGSGKIPAIVEVTAEGTETSLVSLPSDWELREVRHARIADTPHDSPVLNTVRWHIPSGATLSFSVPTLPAGALAQNPSKVPLEIRVKQINLLTSHTDMETFLLKDDPLRIW